MHTRTMAVVSLGIAVVASVLATAAPRETRPAAVDRDSAELANPVGAEPEHEPGAAVVPRSIEGAAPLPLAPLPHRPSYAALPDMHAGGAAGNGPSEPVYDPAADIVRDDEHIAIIDYAALDPSFDPSDREGGPEDIFIVNPPTPVRADREP